MRAAIVWQCLGERPYMQRLGRQLKKHPLGEALRRGGVGPFALYARAFVNRPWPDVDFVKQIIVPAVQGLSPLEQSRLCKIETPLVLPDFRLSINLDADLDWAPDLVERLPSLLQAALRFGVVVTAHPHCCWTKEPLTAAQRAEYESDAGMALQPLPMCGVVVRDHSDDRCRGLSRAWLQEVKRQGSREQPALAKAIWSTGIAPLMAPMTLLSWPADVRQVAGLTPMFRHDPSIEGA